MNRRDFLKFASAAPFAGVAAESFVATGIGESCNYNVDVLVVGGGPAGVCAAISAARNGAKTMVVEQSGMLGGMATLRVDDVMNGVVPPDSVLLAAKLVATLREQKAFLG